MNIENALLYMRTVPYLKKEQLLYRVWYALRQRAGLHHPERLRLSDEAVCWRPLKTVVPFLVITGFDTANIHKGRFRFLNDAAELGEDPDWTGGGRDRLWRYNLHYFAYLMAEGGLPDQTAQHLIDHWLAEVPPGTRDAWDPFPTSLRLVNWIKYLSAASPAPAWADRAVRSICMQASRLESSLEYHLLGNHLFKNAKALIFAGLFCRGRDARRWLSKGHRILRKELDEQVLADGGHFERSPMYHSMILEDCLDLLNVFRGVKSYDGTGGETSCDLEDMTGRLQEITSKMAGFLRGIIHPDGQISLFNDAALGIEQDPDRLFAYYEKVTGRKAENPDRKMRAFPQTGYFTMAPRPGDRLIADCGAIGPDYLPGHSHCDLLSFELSLNGRRVIVDSGCSQYEEGEIRSYNRGNLGHNTLTVDGCNQSEVWGAHRCARRARPLYAQLRKREDGAIVFEGAHGGYKKLSGSPIHHRSICWIGDEIQIRDHVTGRGTHSIESRLHVHPDLAIRQNNGAVVLGDGGKALVKVSFSGTGVIESTQGWYCPEFGLRRRCTVLRILESQADLPYSACWILRSLNS
ncbi:MAG: heparinase II/III family protein [Syntrophobacteraceae bacterium]